MNTQKNFLSNPVVVLFGALICCALWGSAFPCIKIGYNMMHIASSDTASQILYAGCRFTLAGILAVVLGSLTQRQFLLPTKASLPHILELSLLQTILQYLFFYIGLAHTTGVKASIIEAVSTFVAIFVAGFLFHQEKVTARENAWLSCRFCRCCACQRCRKRNGPALYCKRGRCNSFINRCLRIFIGIYETLFGSGQSCDVKRLSVYFRRHCHGCVRLFYGWTPLRIYPACVCHAFLPCRYFRCCVLFMGAAVKIQSDFKSCCVRLYESGYRRAFIRCAAWRKRFFGL